VYIEWSDTQFLTPKARAIEPTTHTDGVHRVVRYLEYFGGLERLGWRRPGLDRVVRLEVAACTPKQPTTTHVDLMF
jgi:hypothetical protein